MGELTHVVLGRHLVAIVSQAELITERGLLAFSLASSANVRELAEPPQTDHAVVGYLKTMQQPCAGWQQIVAVSQIVGIH